MFEMEPLTEIKVNKREREGLTERGRHEETEGEGGTERESWRGREGRKGGMENLSVVLVSIY